MICVEPGRVAANDVLAPGQWARMDQRIFVRDRAAAATAGAAAAADDASL